MIQLAIHEAINGRDLDYAIARATMEEMMDGTATDIEMATLLTALRMKGETITEITACAEVMREKGAHIEPKGAVMDIVGTGGDEVGSFNISTTAAFVAAAGGVPIAKHGNRSVSSKSGAADVLEELGVVLSLSPEQNERVLAETGICFLFAQGYHKSMKNVAPVRKGMGERTIFNVLGPLSNPARATMQLLGVFVNDETEHIAALVRDEVIDIIQLHGGESLHYIEKLRKLTSAPIVYAVRVETHRDIEQADKLPVDYLLLDTYVKHAYGGSGKTFDWSLIGEVDHPYFLAGGLNETNVQRAAQTGAYALDLSSGIETDDVKDMDKMRRVSALVKGANQ